MIVIIDYNAGNIASIQNMLKKIHHECVISSETEDILKAEKLILPGVGSFDHGMQNLMQSHIIETIKTKVLIDKTPILGICLGAQLMGSGSEEGELPGLGLIDMSVVKFKISKMPINCKIPHMGWSEIHIKKNHPVFTDMYPDPRFYFVHSYHFELNQPDDILTTTYYGYEFVSSFQKNNIIGLQFHPEKSHKYGMQILKKFIES